MTQVSERTGDQAGAAAAASEHAAANVQTVAAASEQLAASSREIAAQVSRASGIAQSAAAEAEATDQRVRGLADAAGRIGDVVNLITDIASQTNLLALNATIEAARAGEAGKGFAVVANEVKHLASQTAKATEDIAGQIAAVQEQTRAAVEAIRAIGAIIHDMDEVSGAIAAAVEEQGAATQEITRNIQEAHTGTVEVATNIQGVSQGAGETNRTANEVLASARDLSSQADLMRAVADGFLVRLESGGATLEWGPAWLTGHAVIDADHKMLVQYVNELNAAMREGRGRSVALDVLRKLVQYTRDHFGREEEIWRQGGLSSLGQHLRVHADLVAKVESFERDFAAGHAELTADLMSFLREWLINHVFKTDKAGVRAISTAAA
jgi:methyl-accepting chemotaxis protein